MNWWKKRWEEPSTRWGLLALGGLLGAAFGVPPETSQTFVVQLGGAVAAAASIVQVLREEHKE